MSTEVTVEELTGIDLEGSPPCEVCCIDKVTRHEFRCGRPSVVRVTLKCPDCGYSGSRFLCKRCREEMRKGGIVCYRCITNGRPGDNYDGREI